MKSSFVQTLCAGVFALAATGLFTPEMATAEEGHHEMNPAMEKAGGLLHHRQYEDAAKAYKKIVESDPENAQAWYLLGYALHLGGNLDRAIATYGRAAKFESVAGNAFYNTACAYAVTDRKEKAFEALEMAKHAGFDDLDTIRNDEDLAELREDDRFPYPTRFKVQELDLGHGSKLQFAVVIPAEEEDHDKSYPVLIALAPGDGSMESVNWGLIHLWGQEASRKGWIVVSPTTPEGGWLGESGSRAMTALLDGISHHVKVEGDRFHLAGYSDGAAGAFRAALDQPKRFQTLTALAGGPSGPEDIERLARLKGIDVQLFVGANDSDWLRRVRRTNSTLRRLGVTTDLKIFSGEGRVMKSMTSGGLMAFLDDRRAKNRKGSVRRTALRNGTGHKR